jgi:hypothetical protein
MLLLFFGTDPGGTPAPSILTTSGMPAPVIVVITT